MRSMKARRSARSGHLGAYSFHETKNYICGEGGALCINDPRFVERAEIIRDKGTNRRQFFRGPGGQIHLGRHRLVVCAQRDFLRVLYAQLELAGRNRRPASSQLRVSITRALKPLEVEGLLQLPRIPEDCRSNYHMFYILLRDHRTRDGTARLLEKPKHPRGVSLHSVAQFADGPEVFGYTEHDLPVTNDVSGRLLRLPLFYDITKKRKPRD